MAPGSAPAVAGTASCREAFDLFDSDDDGLLSKEEITLGLCLLAEPVDEGDVDFLIGLCDGDGDGMISRKEFAHLRQLAPPPFYGGSPMFATFGSRLIDTASFDHYLRGRGVKIPLRAIRGFLRNIHPRRRPVLPRRLYERFFSSYRTS